MTKENKIATQEEMKNEFLKKFTENDEDGLHIYESGDVEGIVRFWLSKIQERETALVEMIIEELFPTGTDTDMSSYGWIIDVLDSHLQDIK